MRSWIKIDQLSRKMLHDLCKSGMECFMDQGRTRQDSYMSLVASLVAMLISLFLVAFVGKFLWNSSVAELFTFARPVQSAWQIIAFMLLLSILR